MGQGKRFAVLIDADNISSKYIKYILQEISNNGTVTYKRIYGDWTKEGTSGWKKVLLENSILPIQQYSYTTGKNATDSAMIIDAMDILYSNKVEGFCLVSSDSDFTRLATRLRESGMEVVGMGEQKTPKAFSVACNVFKYIDILAEQEDDDEAEVQGSIQKGANNINDRQEIIKGMTSKNTIKKTIMQMISEYGQDEKGIDMGDLGNRLVRRYPDFDVRNYGYSKLSKMLEGFNEIEMIKEGCTVTLKTVKSDSKDVEAIIIRLIEKSPNRQINMSGLRNEIMKVKTNFDIRNYGYTKFSKFIEDMPSVRIMSRGRNRQVKVVVLKNKTIN